MIKRSYSLQLATPAFLGGADQRAEWRTPPFKALIREWWRIAVAPEVGFSFSRLKERETELFGTAADEGGGENHKSLIRLALASWSEGKLNSWPAGEPRVPHPEVKNRETGAARPVGSELYLGYGPLVFQQGSTHLKNGAALQADETNTLKLAFPETQADAMTRALTLAHWFGTIGGRSRNGWGSFALKCISGAETALARISHEALKQTGSTRALTQCLSLDWPHAIGTDPTGPLVWHSKAAFANWREAMRFLAQVKVGFRTSLEFNSGKNAIRVEKRHVLAYPVTNHSVGQWGNNARIANTLRFKLQRDDDGTFRALIFHTPCRPTLPHDGIDLLGTWQTVHKHLDAHPQLTRLS